MAARRFFLSVLLASLILLAGCETSLGPYAATNRYFSIFGILNAADDMHWVRIEALRDGQPIGAGSTLDATVILTHLASGRQVTLKDSLFTYPQQELAHNFYGRMNLQLEDTYRLVVRDSSGNTSTATVMMPHSFPEVSLSERGTTATIEGGTEDRFLFLTVLYHTIVEEPPPENIPGAGPSVYPLTFTVQYAERAVRNSAGYSAALTWREDIRSAWTGGPASITLTGVGVEVGLVDSEAPVYDGLPYEILFRPGVAPSNVENGYGYLAGVTTDKDSVVLPPDERPQVEVGN